MAAKKTTGSQSRSKKSTGSRSGGTKTGSQSRAKTGSKKASAKSAKGLTKAQEQKLAQEQLIILTNPADGFSVSNGRTLI